MISIVVCSIDLSMFNRFSKSLSETIGVPFELIKIENKTEKLSISEAYNNGALNARFDYLVFIHEDIVFHTLNWGQNLVWYFETLNNPGLLGIAGNSYQPLSPSDWWGTLDRTRHFNYIKNGRNGDHSSGILVKSNDIHPKKVYCIDGIFLALKKNVFSKFKFDEELKGFHGYDTSLSLRISENFDNYFIPNILLEHFSNGDITKEYWINTILACKKYKSCQNDFDFNVEYLALKRFVRKSIQNRISFAFFFRTLLLINSKFIIRIFR